MTPGRNQGQAAAAGEARVGRGRGETPARRHLFKLIVARSRPNKATRVRHSAGSAKEQRRSREGLRDETAAAARVEEAEKEEGQREGTPMEEKRARGSSRLPAVRRIVFHPFLSPRFQRPLPHPPLLLASIFASSSSSCPSRFFFRPAPNNPDGRRASHSRRRQNNCQRKRRIDVFSLDRDARALSLYFQIEERGPGMGIDLRSPGKVCQVSGKTVGRAVFARRTKSRRRFCG